MNKRILCLDVGDVRIGVAVSDPTRTIATPVEVIRRVGWGPDARRVKALCDQYDTAEYGRHGRFSGSKGEGILRSGGKAGIEGVFSR